MYGLLQSRINYCSLIKICHPVLTHYTIKWLCLVNTHFRHLCHKLILHQRNLFISFEKILGGIKVHPQFRILHSVRGYHKSFTKILFDETRVSILITYNLHTKVIGLVLFIVRWWNVPRWAFRWMEFLLHKLSINTAGHLYLYKIKWHTRITT